jgi:hypothetical protein
MMFQRRPPRAERELPCQLGSIVPISMPSPRPTAPNSSGRSSTRCCRERWSGKCMLRAARGIALVASPAHSYAPPIACLRPEVMLPSPRRAVRARLLRLRRAGVATRACMLRVLRAWLRVLLVVRVWLRVLLALAFALRRAAVGEARADFLLDFSAGPPARASEVSAP